MGDDELDDDLGPGRDCPTCGRPLTPEPLDGGTLALVWTCPLHGAIDLTPDALGEA
ncbi:hypothetical protein GCM10022200_05450 [Microbacterium awajiense]|uniref:Transcription factor zinc-finger domain-containing protein n=1 Tax=Microbacterium awajiense TaxID=415214 RepID=A0ABP7A6L6_9MICO